LLDSLEVSTLMSHLACADEDVDANRHQLDAFRAVTAAVPAAAYSLANSAGICLGPDYRFDLTRPGLALYGGVPRAEAAGQIAPVLRLEAQVVQRRRVGSGDPVGYNATFAADAPMELAILNLGYADGYLRAFSGKGHARSDPSPPRSSAAYRWTLPPSASMPPRSCAKGDWVEMDLDLPPPPSNPAFRNMNC
jgi:alanine racemase